MTSETYPEERRSAEAMIFVVEDETDIASLISRTLNGAGLSTCVFLDGQNVVEATNEQLPALVLLDVMLPGIDGLEVLRRLEAQQRTRGIPKIMLSARSSELDKVRALELGADDYLTKPFSLRELVARVHAVLRAKSVSTEKHNTIEMGNLVADLDARRVTVGGEEIICTATEFNILVYFMGHPGLVISRDRLIEKIWPSDRPIEESRIVDVYIRRLREKIEADPSNPSRLMTRRRNGYVLLNLD